MAKNAGQAYVEISAKDNTDKALTALTNRLKKTGESVSAVGQKVALVGAGIIASITGVGVAFASMGDEIAKASSRTGIAADALSELKYAADQSGTDLGTLETAIKKMSKTLVDADAGQKKASASLATIGLSAQQLINLKPDEQFKTIAQAISEISSPTERAAASLALFGKAGTTLIPLVADGRAGIEALQKSARDLGLSMSTQDSKAAEEFGDRMDDLEMSVKQVAFQLGAAAAPALRAFVVRKTEAVVAVINFIKANRDQVVALAATALKFASVAVAVGGVVLAVGKLISISGSVIAATKGVGVAMTFLAANPAVLLLGAVVALTAGLAAYYYVSKQFANTPLEHHMEDVAAAAEEAKGETLSLMQQLDKIASKGKLTPDDSDRAQAVIAQLRKRYGELGISIDAATGKLTGMGEAYGRIEAIEKQRQITLEKANIAEANRNIQTLGAKAAKLAPLAEDSFANYHGDALNDSAAVAKNLAELDKTTEQLDALREKLRASAEKLHELQAGKTTAFTGVKPGNRVQDGSPDVGDEDDDGDEKPKSAKAAAKEAAEAAKDAAKELADARKELDRSENEQRKAGLSETEKAIDEVNERYQEQYDLLQKLGIAAKGSGDAKTFKKLSDEYVQAGKQRDIDLAKIKVDADKKAKEEADKKAEDDKRRALDAIKTEEEKVETILDLQKRIAEQNGDKAGADAIQKKIDAAALKRQLDETYQNDPKGRANAQKLADQISNAPKTTYSSAGSFDAGTQSLRALSGGSNKQAEIAKNTADAVKELKAMRQSKIAYK